MSDLVMSGINKLFSLTHYIDYLHYQIKSEYRFCKSTKFLQEFFSTGSYRGWYDFHDHQFLQSKFYHGMEDEIKKNLMKMFLDQKHLRNVFF